MSGGGGTAPTPTLNALEQAAQIFTDYYEGEVSVKPSNLRAFPIYWNKVGEIIMGIVPDNFTSKPFPTVLLKNSSEEVFTMSLNTSVKPNVVQSINDFGMSVNAFMEQQTLADNGFLLIGWVDEDDSLIGMKKHPSR